MRDNKTAAIIQTRMGSTRLPGKVMKELKGKPVLWHVIQRVKQSKMIDEIIIATTTKEKDKIIYEKSLDWGVKAFRGSEEDVLKRYYDASAENNVKNIVRITSDCPLIDPYITDEIIRYYNDYDYILVTNAGSDLEKRTYPRGLDTEVFSFKALEKAYNRAKKIYQREHVTPFIYENYDNIYYYKNDIDYSDYRLTLDEEDDWKLIKIIYDELYNQKHNFYLQDILDLFKERPQLTNINKQVEQKTYEN